MNQGATLVGDNWSRMEDKNRIFIFDFYIVFKDNSCFCEKQKLEKCALKAACVPSGPLSSV